MHIRSKFMDYLCHHPISLTEQFWSIRSERIIRLLNIWSQNFLHLMTTFSSTVLQHNVKIMCMSIKLGRKCLIKYAHCKLVLKLSEILLGAISVRVCSKQLIHSFPPVVEDTTASIFNQHVPCWLMTQCKANAQKTCSCILASPLWDDCCVNLRFFILWDWVKWPQGSVLPIIIYKRNICFCTFEGKFEGFFCNIPYFKSLFPFLFNHSLCCFVLSEASLFLKTSSPRYFPLIQQK